MANLITLFCQKAIWNALYQDIQLEKNKEKIIILENVNRIIVFHYCKYQFKKLHALIIQITVILHTKTEVQLTTFS